MMEKQLTPIIKDAFLQFSGAVLQSRALVDVRDCIKPSARQIFYCLYTDKFIHSKPFQKTLKAIGSAFRLYIHGDSSAEGVIMRAGQPFAMRYPLVEVEGSYGTLLASGSWAAPRYTSSRLSPLAEYLFADLQKNTIAEWRDNYDNTEQYPTVLPSKGFFNLVNGSYGIGVGASSSIPQYNLRELNSALIKLIKNPDCSFDEIYCTPDFATGATLINPTQVKESHKNGTGFACKLRATVEWDKKERCFIVTEIPYMLYTETLCKEFEDIINGEDNPGIERFNDLTGEKVNIKIYLSKTANPDKILKFLYKNTSLESYYGVNFTLLKDGRYPQVFTWKQILEEHIQHERNVYRRGFEFDLRKIEDRIHILDGLILCVANIEEVVRIIKNSSSTTTAAAALQEKFILDSAQTKAILDMKLSRLAHLEVKKLEDERSHLINEAAHIKKILDSKELLDNEIIKGLEEVARKFGDERRTKVINLESGANDEPIEIKQLQVSLTNKSNLIASESSSLYVQRRGGAGKKYKMDDGEYITNTLTLNSNEELLLFTNLGTVYHYNSGALPIEEKIPIISLVPLKDWEQICAITSLNTNKDKKYICFITKKGLIKKTELSEYNTNRAGSLKAINLDEGDSIVDIIFTDEDKIGILTECGNFLIIDSKPIRSIGRIARGVRAIKLNDNDSVISAKVVPSTTKMIISISGNGLFKKTSYNEFTVQSRDTKGSRIQRHNEGDWSADFLPISSEGEILVASTRSCIKLATTDVPTSSRGATGVKSIKISEKDNIIGICLS